MEPSSFPEKGSARAFSIYEHEFQIRHPHGVRKSDREKSFGKLPVNRAISTSPISIAGMSGDIFTDSPVTIPGVIWRYVLGIVHDSV
jgi:hypothetical protein